MACVLRVSCTSIFVAKKRASSSCPVSVVCDTPRSALKELGRDKTVPSHPVLSHSSVRSAIGGNSHLSFFIHLLVYPYIPIDIF